MILLLAGLQSIPRELEEAAAVDGATRGQALRYVTCPLLGPTIRVSIFLSMIGALQLFDVIWVTTGGGPVNASNTMATYMIDWGFKRYQLGYGSAIAVILFVLAFILALAYQRYVLRRDIDGAMTAEPADGRDRDRRRAPVRSIATTARVGRVVRDAMRAVLMVAVAAAIVIPIVYAVLAGFKDSGQIAADPIGLPNPWVFTELHRDPDVGRRSGSRWATACFVAALSTAMVVLFAALAAFVFARRGFPGREAIFTLFTLGLLFPAAVAILPLFILVRDLGLLDNPLGIALPEAAFGLPLTIIILRPFFRAIPVELEDAAAIDGCSQFGFFWRVLLPMSRPVLATVAVLAIVFSWNQFLLPLVMVSSPDRWTLPLGVTNFSTQYSADTARILAYTTLSLIPALVFYVVAERQLVGGLTAGAVKG